MVFIAERLLMSKLQPVTNALMKSGIRALLGTDGDAAVQERWLREITNRCGKQPCRKVRTQAA